MKKIVFLLMLMPSLLCAQVSIKREVNCTNNLRADLQGTCVQYYITQFADSNYNGIGDSIIIKVTSKENEVFFKKLVYYKNPESGAQKFTVVYSDTKDFNIVFLDQKKGFFDVSFYAKSPRNYCWMDIVYISNSQGKKPSPSAIKLEGCQ